MDRDIGRILEKIEDLDLFANSIVVFMPDHGMRLDEHNRTGKFNINTNDLRFWPGPYALPYTRKWCIASSSCALRVWKPARKSSLTCNRLILSLCSWNWRVCATAWSLLRVPAVRPPELEPRDFAVTASYLRRRDNVLPVQAVIPRCYERTADPMAET